jgi:hypothetical protein
MLRSYSTSSLNALLCGGFPARVLLACSQLLMQLLMQLLLHVQVMPASQSVQRANFPN